MENSNALYSVIYRIRQVKKIPNFCFKRKRDTGMIKGINVAHLKEKLVGDPEARFYIVAQKAPNYIKFNQTQDGQVLAPSAKIEQELKLGDITRDEYKRKYTKELERPVAQELMRYLQNEARDKDTFIVCDFDERFLLLNAIHHLK